MRFIKKIFFFSLLMISIYTMHAQMPVLSHSHIQFVEKASSALALGSIKCGFYFDKMGFLYSAFAFSAINVLAHASLCATHKKDTKNMIKMMPALGIVVGGALHAVQHPLNNLFGANGFYAGQNLVDASYYAMWLKEVADIYELVIQK